MDNAATHLPTDVDTINELEAMQAIADILDHQTSDTVGRILRWAVDFYGVQTPLILRRPGQHQGADE